MATIEKSYSQMRKEFQDKFFKELSPALEKFDAERKGKLRLAVAGAVICFVIGILLIISPFFITMSEETSENTFKSGIGMFFMAGFVWAIIKKNFENKIKEKIMPSVCQCFGDISWKKCILYENRKVFQESNLIPSFFSSSFDDYFSGSYKDVGFEIIESEFSTGTGKNRRTVFNGVIVKLDMNKNFSGNTVIRPDSMFHASPSSNLVHTTLEDVVFEKKFDVFTDDEVEARYLITPSFMERLNNMQVAFAADKVSCAFYGTNLFVALHTLKDLFSICSLLKPVNDGKQFFQMFEEILSIIKLIDHFKLDQKIGM